MKRDASRNGDTLGSAYSLRTQLTFSLHMGLCFSLQVRSYSEAR